MTDGPPLAERERRRARSTVDAGSRRGRLNAPDGSATGHAAIYRMRPALELGRMPEGGGYPVGFVEEAARIMGHPVANLVHLCAGSVAGGRLTIDLRSSAHPAGHRHHSPDVHPDVIADVRWLPLGPDTVDAILVDPPYDRAYAAALWNIAAEYPTPSTILRECAVALRPGGIVGILHHIVPMQVDTLTRLGTWGVTTGLGYRIRAFTVYRHDPAPARLFDA